MRAKDVADFGVRLVFFATAPLLLVRVAALFPMTGALVQIAITLVLFFAAEAARGLAARSRLARLALRNQLEFEAYYRAHRPRPFLYYVFYPLLFPYWLFVREARREFLVFNGYTLLSVGVLLASLVVQYVRSFPPQLGLGRFWPLAMGTFAIQTAAVLMFLMPIATTVVHYHLLRAPRRLVALLLVALVPVGWSVARLERRRDPIVSFATRARVRMRTSANGDAARAAQTEALRAAWAALPTNRSDVDSDGKVEGTPLEKAHEALAVFYKNDEAQAFDLWFTRSGPGTAVLVVYFEARGKNAPIWLGMDRKRAPFDDPARLPAGAFAAMRRATR